MFVPRHLLTYQAEPVRLLSIAFEALQISDGRDYGACRSQPKAANPRVFGIVCLCTARAMDSVALLAFIMGEFASNS